jgi:hypothetical protein
MERGGGKQGAWSRERGGGKHGAGSRERGTQIRIIGSVLLALCSLLVWPGGAVGDAGGDVESEEALAEAGIADQQRDSAERNPPGPEPAGGDGLNVGQPDGAGDSGGVVEVVGGHGIGFRIGDFGLRIRGTEKEH